MHPMNVHNKPEVDILNSELFDCYGSTRARGLALNHPRLGCDSVVTSTVLLWEDDWFETLNTFYVRLNGKEFDKYKGVDV